MFQRGRGLSVAGLGWHSGAQEAAGAVRPTTFPSAARSDIEAEPAARKGARALFVFGQCCPQYVALQMAFQDRDRLMTSWNRFPLVVFFKLGERPREPASNPPWVLEYSQLASCQSAGQLSVRVRHSSSDS
jgi:hypothetical protein